jgi:hypothetical protein
METRRRRNFQAAHDLAKYFSPAKPGWRQNKQLSGFCFLSAPILTIKEFASFF